MREEISLEVFNRLIDLASFEFEPAQAEYLRQQLNHQLKAIHELEAIVLDKDLVPAIHGISYAKKHNPTLREDQAVVDGNREQIIAQMPAFEDGYVIVPDLKHETLE